VPLLRKRPCELGPDSQDCCGAAASRFSRSAANARHARLSASRYFPRPASTSPPPCQDPRHYLAGPLGLGYSKASAWPQRRPRRQQSTSTRLFPSPDEIQSSGSDAVLNIKPPSRSDL